MCFPYHSFNFLECRTANITRSKIVAVNARIIWFWILHSVVTSSCAITVPTFTCWNARLATSVLSFLCLHNIYIAKVVTNSDITAVTNRKTSIIEVLEKTFLLVGKSVTMDISCLLLKSMISFLWLYWWIKSFRFLGDVSRYESDLDIFKDIGRVCLKVVLFFIFGSLAECQRAYAVMNCLHHYCCHHLLWPILLHTY